VRSLLSIAGFCFAAFAVSTFPGFPRENGAWIYDGVLYCGVGFAAAGACLIRARRSPGERLAWILLAIGVTASTFGDMIWSVWIAELDPAPWPSVADGFYIAFYPLAYATIGLLFRGRLSRFQVSMWLDGLVSALAVTAVVAALMFAPIVAETGGDVLAVATTFVYPIGDLLLLALVAGFFTLIGWRPGRALALIGGGVVSFAFADSIYLYQSAIGTYAEGRPLDALWPLGTMLIAFAAASSPAKQREVRLETWAVLVVPALCVLLALAVLVYGTSHDVSPLSTVLATGAILAAVARMFLTLREVRSLSEARRLALTDELTGLPNRRALIDLDGFKELNDTLGHPVGDQLLRDIGPRLRPALASTDMLARLGGDEFAILISGLARPDLALALGVRLRQALEEPFELEGLAAQIDASVGIAFHPMHASDATTLLKHSDVAMYEAKRERSGVELYDHARNRHSRDRIAMVGELRRGIDRGELELHYQPQVDLSTGALVGIEALARWRRNGSALVPPVDFLPSVEQTSLMRPFTDRVLADALEQVVRWRQAGFHMQVAVNVAASNLVDVAFPDRVRVQLLEAGATPADLRIEITETAVMADVERCCRVLEALRGLGVSLALDDFGVGHSSLSNLKRLPVDELKVDRSFVMNIVTDERDAAMVRATAALGGALGLCVVAEGIEDVLAYEAVRAAGCHRAQGFLVARPMPADDVLGWATEWQARPPVWARSPRLDGGRLTRVAGPTPAPFVARI
jgi:diguanylate cyclase (GGDEF)-like protein